jgi:hypothetical protein
MPPAHAADMEPVGRPAGAQIDGEINLRSATARAKSLEEATRGSWESPRPSSRLYLYACCLYVWCRVRV